jgi:hypothetical protein
VPLGRFETFGHSDAGRYVAICGAGKVALYQDDRLVFSTESELVHPRVAAVSPDGMYLAAAEADRMELFDRSKGGLAWTITSGQAGLQFISLDLAGGPDALLAGLDLAGDSSDTYRHTAGSVFLLSKDGRLRWRDDFQYSTWNVHVPAVHFVDAQKQIEVQLASEIRYYSLP